MSLNLYDILTSVINENKVRLALNESVSENEIMDAITYFYDNLASDPKGITS